MIPRKGEVSHVDGGYVTKNVVQCWIESNWQRTSSIDLLGAAQTSENGKSKSKIILL
jgi:hypothetical protein